MLTSSPSFGIQCWLFCFYSLFLKFKIISKKEDIMKITKGNINPIFKF